MKLSELIAAYGDDRVQCQNLDQSLIGLTMVKGVTKITFGTDQPADLRGPEKLGLVVWLDRKWVAEFNAARKTAEASLSAATDRAEVAEAAQAKAETVIAGPNAQVTAERDRILGHVAGLFSALGGLAEFAQVNRDTQRAIEVAARDGVASGVRLAAQLIAGRRDSYVEAHGWVDPETGQHEFPGNGAEWVGEMDEIEEAMLALAQASTQSTTEPSSEGQNHG